MTVKTEPALAAGLAAIALLVVYGVLTDTQGAAWGALLVPLVQAIWTRSKVMPVETIREAGISPNTLNERADNPNIQRNDA